MLSSAKHKIQLIRANIKDARDQSGIPIPPPKLRHRVHGSFDRDGYLAVGRECWKSIERLAESTGNPVLDTHVILDFGCGSGRTIRNVSKAREAWGIDIDSEAIAWCQKQLKRFNFRKEASLPPTSFADNYFDLIYAVSVFTHLDEQMQFHWLSELARIAKPEAIVIASVHGEYHRSLCSKKFDMTKGFVFTKSKSKKDGLPDFYQDTQHTKSYVENNWSKYFEVINYVERGMANHQDAVLMRAR